MENFKVGIMGAGTIAGKIAATLNALEGFEVHAIGSRDLEKAKAFGAEYGIKNCYGSYEEVAKDPEVELVYVATPHSHHVEPAKLALNNNKPVLVEKAFSYNSATALEILNLARQKNLFCGEAMWIRFLPLYHMIMDYIEKKAIGQVSSVSCNLGFGIYENERIKNPELAGGALLDLGVYPINFVSMMTRLAPSAISSNHMRSNTGVDVQEVMNFRFAGGQTANAFITTLYQSDNNATVYGTCGYIEIDNMLCPTAFRVYREGKLIGEHKVPESQISGYEYEFIAARNCLITGKTELPEMPHSETIRIMNIMDGMRKAWKISFPLPGETPVEEIEEPAEIDPAKLNG